MSRIRALLILALIAGQAIALMAGTLIYANPVVQTALDDGTIVLNRPWIVGVLLGVLAALWTAMIARLVIEGCEEGFESVRNELNATIGKQFEELMTTRNAVIFGMARLSESRDVMTGKHLQRIRGYVGLLAHQVRKDQPELRELMTDRWIDDLCLSSVLHDIGKVGVPDSILRKPGTLSRQEYEQIKKHTCIGGDCLHALERQLGESNFLMLAREIAYAHHEWWNGEGYPFGLQGQAIPLSARIVALADVYDALTTSRSYKAACRHEEAVEIIKMGSGSQFDPMIVNAFRKVESAFDQLRAELASDESPYVFAEAA